MVLSHKHEDAAIFLVYEELEDDFELRDYTDAIMEIKGSNLGISAFSVAFKSPIGLTYESAGVMAHEDSIYDSSVRVWSNASKKFWHSIVLTPIDSRALKLEALQLADELAKSTTDLSAHY